MEINTKEIEAVREKTSRIVVVANSIEVIDEGTMLAAGETLREIKLTAKMVKERKEEITKPMNEALKSVRSMFAPFEDQCDEAVAVVSRKMLGWQRDAEEKVRKAEEMAAKIRAEAQRKLEEGKTTQEKVDALDEKIDEKLDALPEAVRSSTDFHTREIKKFRVTNEAEIPREYLVLDDVKVRKAMMAGVEVRGIEYYKEKTLV